MSTNLDDCDVIADFSAYDASLTLDNVTFGSGATSQLQADGITTLNIPTLEVVWDLPTNPYVTGIEIEYARGPMTINAPVQNAQNAFYSTSNNIMTNATYSCRWRAVGLNKFGLWSTPVDVLITGLFGLAGPDGILTDSDLITFLWTIPLNLVTFSELVAQTGAIKLGVPPDDPYTVFGEALQAFEIAGGSPGIKVVRTGTADLASKGYSYAHSFWARTSDTGGSTIRIGFRRTSDGTAFSGLTDQVYSLTTTWTEFVWDPISSNATGWDSPADLRYFYNSGDVDSGETVSITDIQINQGPKLGFGHQAIWRPSPNEVALMRQAGLLEELFNAERLSHPNMRIVSSPDGLAHQYIPLGVRDPRTITGTSYSVTVDDAGSYLRFTNGSAIAVTLPAGLWTAMTVGGQKPGAVASVSQRGAGVVTIGGGSGVTVNPLLGGGYVTQGNGDVIQIIATDVTNVFDLV